MTGTGPILASLAKPLLVLHVVAAVVLAGSLTHLALLSLRRLRRGARFGRLGTVWARVAGVSYAASFAIGLAMYPHFRYHVRGLWLDRWAPWASNLFDIKENLLGMGLPLALALVLLGRRLAEPDGDEALGPPVAWAAIVLWLMATASMVMGVLVTNTRGV